MPKQKNQSEPQSHQHRAASLRRQNQHGSRKITPDSPLTSFEVAFVNAYIHCGNGAMALEQADTTGTIANKSDNAKRLQASRMLKAPHIKAEIERIMDEIRKDTIMTATEVMEYFTAVARGEIKDQFGLDAPLSERTKAAQEIAKRTVDIENRKAGVADSVVQIKLDWSR